MNPTNPGYFQTCFDDIASTKTIHQFLQVLSLAGELKHKENGRRALTQSKKNWSTVSVVFKNYVKITFTHKGQEQSHQQLE